MKIAKTKSKAETKDTWTPVIKKDKRKPLVGTITLTRIFTHTLANGTILQVMVIFSPKTHGVAIVVSTSDYFAASEFIADINSPELVIKSQVSEFDDRDVPNLMVTEEPKKERAVLLAFFKNMMESVVNDLVQNS